MMVRKSKLKRCPYCDGEFHARGLKSHIAHKHSLVNDIPETVPSREPITATQHHEGLDIQPKYQLSIRSEPTEVVKQKDNGVKTPSQTPAKPTKSDWKPLAVIAGVTGAIWLLYETIPEVRDAFQRHWRGETYDRRKQRV